LRGSGTAEAETTTASNAVSERTAERRQLSMMFCDLVGSTELSSRLDPEDLSQLIRTYQGRVRDTIARFGGFIARYVGDGVLIYFCWSEARELKPEWAVRAALAIVAELGDIPIANETLQVRIGIATGRPCHCRRADWSWRLTPADGDRGDAQPSGTVARTGWPESCDYRWRDTPVDWRII